MAPVANAFRGMIEARDSTIQSPSYSPGIDSSRGPDVGMTVGINIAIFAAIFILMCVLTAVRRSNRQRRMENATFYLPSEMKQTTSRGPDDDIPTQPPPAYCRGHGWFGGGGLSHGDNHHHHSENCGHAHGGSPPNPYNFYGGAVGRGGV